MGWRDYDMVVILPALFALAFVMDKADVWLRSRVQRPLAIALRRCVRRLGALPRHVISWTRQWREG